MCRRAHHPLLNSLGGCAGTCYLTYSVKNRPPFLFCIYSMKKTSGGGITMNTEYDSELICDPSSGWVSLRGVKPLRKYPQDPKRALWFFPSPIPRTNIFPQLDLSGICRRGEVPEAPELQHLISSTSFAAHVTARFRDGHEHHSKDDYSTWYL